jgi:hypothetical protein
MFTHTDGRLLEITQLYLTPQREIIAPEDSAELAAKEEDIPTSRDSTIGSESDAVPLAASGGLPGSGSFHFMQASEIETPFEVVEWVEKTDAEEPPVAEIVPGGHVAEKSVIPAGEVSLVFRLS